LRENDLRTGAFSVKKEGVAGPKRELRWVSVRVGKRFERMRKEAAFYWAFPTAA
jgi:hypothetical protein